MGDKTMIYAYWTWVPGEGLGGIAPGKLPLAEIEALGGLPILTSAEPIDEVEESEENPGFSADPDALVGEDLGAEPDAAEGAVDPALLPAMRLAARGCSCPGTP
ncbi:hypothetical protein [Acidisoma sp. C75]